MNETTVTESTESEISVADYIKGDTVSGYGLIKATNEVLKEMGIEKVLPGPMGYTYIKKGYVDGVKGADRKSCSKESAVEWIEKYVSKLVAKSVQVETVTEEVTESE